MTWMQAAHMVEDTVFIAGFFLVLAYDAYPHVVGYVALHLLFTCIFIFWSARIAMFSFFDFFL